MYNNVMKVKENGFKEYLRDFLIDLNRIIKDKTIKDIPIYLKIKERLPTQKFLEI